ALSRTAPGDSGAYSSGGAFDASLFAETVIEENYMEDDFRRLIGLNVFDDVTWFNKEAFESALFYGKLFFVLESDSAFARPLPWLERVKRVAEISGAVEKAQAASGYRLDNLLRLLAEGGAAGKEKPGGGGAGAGTRRKKKG
ncbi:MAG: hypothetical protein FWH38_10565, partial [Treponema sp.]|nr:hypothetical protein [Treponema sp.]